MFTLYYRGREEEELTLELPCTQEEYTAVYKQAREKKPFMMDQEESFEGVSVLDDISQLNALAHLAQDAKDEDEDKFDAYMEFGCESESCSCIRDWINLMAQFDNVEWYDSEPDYEEIGTDFMNDECTSKFIDKFDEAGLDVAEIGEVVFADWDAYEAVGGWFDTSEYYNGRWYDIPEGYMLETPTVFEPLNLKDKEVLKDLFGRTIHRETENFEYTGRITGCYINKDENKCTVRVLGVDITAEQLMNWTDFYTGEPMAKEIIE